MAVKYLVSGGEGALGKTVISMLLQRGEKVRILMSELSDTRIYRNNPNIEICYGISTDKDSMIEFFNLEDPRSAVLFHTDEYVSLSDSTNLTMRRVNVIGAENIVDMCLKRKIGKLVYLSSAYAMNPEAKGEDLTIHFDRNKVEGEYAKSKAEAAAYVLERVSMNRLNAVMVLPTFIIGPGYSEDYEINKVLNSYLNNGTIPPKDGGRAFVDVRDVANAMLALADKGEPGAGYIVSGDYKTSGEFFKDVNEIQGKDKPVKTASRLVMSKSLAKLVDFYYKITHKENPKEAYTLFSDNPDARFEDNSKGVLPELTISFKDSLKDTIEGAQRGGVQAASAVAQNTTEKKTSADAMEARLKQQQQVASKASAVSTAASDTPVRPAHTRPASAVAAKAEEEKAEKEEKEENKSIRPLSTLKDPDEKNAEEGEEKLNSGETTFRFGAAPSKLSDEESTSEKLSPTPVLGGKLGSASSPFAPKAESAKPAVTPEAPKPSTPINSAFKPAVPEKKEAPVSSAFKPAEPEKKDAPVSSVFKTAQPEKKETATAAPSPFKPAEPEKKTAPAASGFPRPGFTRTTEAPKPSTPINSAFKPAEPEKKETPASSAFKPVETEKKDAPVSSVFKSSQPEKKETVTAAPSPFKPAEPEKKAAPAASGFPRPGFTRATEAPKPSTPINSAFKPAEPEKKETPASSAFKPIETEKKDAPVSSVFKSSQPEKKETVTAAPSPFKPAEPEKKTAPAASGFPRPGFTRATEAPKPSTPINSAFKPAEPEKKAAPASSAFKPIETEKKDAPVSSVFKPAQPEKKETFSTTPSPFKPANPEKKTTSATSGFPRPSATTAAKKETTNPINSAFMASGRGSSSSESSGFLRSSEGPSTSYPTIQATPTAATRTEPISSAFKSTSIPTNNANANSFKPLGNANPVNKAPAKEEKVDDFFDDIEKEIENYAASEGPVVPPGIFAPPPKPGT